MLKLLSNMTGLFLVFVVGLLLVGGAQAKRVLLETWDRAAAWVEVSEKVANSLPDKLTMPLQAPEVVLEPVAGQNSASESRTPAGSADVAEVKENQPVGDVSQRSALAGKASSLSWDDEDPVLLERPSHGANEVVLQEGQDHKDQSGQEAQVTTHQLRKSGEDAFGVQDAKVGQALNSSVIADNHFTESEKRQFMVEASEFGERALRALSDIDTRLGRK